MSLEKKIINKNKAIKILEVNNISKTYGGNIALDNINFDINQGEYVVLLGPNGAGKTTLFSLLTGLFASNQGNIFINGNNIISNATNALGSIGVVFQQTTIDLDLTVKDNLIFHSRLHGLSKIEFNTKIENELEQVNLIDKKNIKARFLSGGEKRKIELARSLIHNPKLLLMDEPTVGLDPQSRVDLLNYILKLKKERAISILWATHLVDEAEKADSIIILNKGKILDYNTPKHIIKASRSENLGESFIKLTKRKD